MKQLLHFTLLALGAMALFSACEDALSEEGSYVGTLTVSGPNGTATENDATITADAEIEFFDLSGTDLDFSLSIDDYTGSGRYTLKTSGGIADYDDGDDFYDYEEGNGYVDISEAAGERISGTFSFSAKDLDDHSQTISGSFEMVAE